MKENKINLELTFRVEMGILEIKGTGLQGYLPRGARYRDIVKVFGRPQLGKSLDGKIQVEWIGKINGLVFTIYDYKSKVDPKANTDWHIGGKTYFAADLVKVYFFANNLTPNSFSILKNPQ
jgi:hypothetical protein